MPSARELMKAELKESVQESQESKNFNSSSFETYFTVPDGRSQWIPEGNDDGVKHYWDCIPFRIGKHFPDKTLKKAPKPGTFRHVMDIHMHKNVGPLGASVVCPMNTFKAGKCFSDEEAVELGRVADPEENVVGCPICEHLKSAQADEPDADKRKAIWKEKKAYRRVMYNAIVRDGGEEEEKGCQIYEVSHHFMQKNLDTLSEEDERAGTGAVTYPDPDEGKTIYFVYKKSGKGKDTTAAYEGHRFVDRMVKGKPYVISDEELEDAICLDDTLILMTYKELNDLYWSVESKKTEDTKQEEKKEEKQEDSRGSRRLKRSTTEETPEPEKKDEEKQEEQSTKRLSRTREEESPADRGLIAKCPSMLEFGKDTLTNEECNKCADDVYKACKAKKDELEAVEKPRGRRILKRD